MGWEIRRGSIGYLQKSKRFSLEFHLKIRHIYWESMSFHHSAQGGGKGRVHEEKVYWDFFCFRACVLRGVPDRAPTRRRRHRRGQNLRRLDRRCTPRHQYPDHHQYTYNNRHKRIDGNSARNRYTYPRGDCRGMGRRSPWNVRHDVLKIHPKSESMSVPENLGTDAEGLIVRWNCPTASLIFKRRWGDDGIYCYRVQEIQLHKQSQPTFNSFQPSLRT